MALSHDKGPMSHDPAGAHILAITCVFGNTLLDNVMLNVLKVLRACGRLDVSIKYFQKLKANRPCPRDYSTHRQTPGLILTLLCSFLPLEKLSP